MKNVTRLLIKAALTTALVACAGQSSDPTKDFKDVKLVKPHEDQHEIQTFELDLFEVETKGSNNLSHGNFTEGKQGKLTVIIKSLMGKALDANIEFLNFPYANEPKVAKTSANTYDVVWTPPTGTVGQGRTSQDVNFDLKVTAEGQTEIVPALFLVSRTNDIPKIVNVSGFKDSKGLALKFEEGSKVKFSVEVEDPNYAGSGLPQVAPLPHRHSNVEAFYANGSGRIDQDYDQRINPVVRGNKFKFFYTLDLHNLPKYRDGKNKVDERVATVDLCFKLLALSVTKTPSVEAPHCVTVHYKAQGAQIKFESDDNKIVAGKENEVKFSLFTTNSLSEIEVLKMDDVTKALAGSATLDCPKGNAVACVLKWNPTCNAKSNSRNKSILRLRVNSTLNGKSIATKYQKQYEIDHTECEAIAKEKAEADKKAAEEKAAQAKAEAEAKKAAEAAKKEEANQTNSEKKS